jgi:sec-independent protein translocase protein TatC
MDDEGSDRPASGEDADTADEDTPPEPSTDDAPAAPETAESDPDEDTPPADGTAGTDEVAEAEDADAEDADATAATDDTATDAAEDEDTPETTAGGGEFDYSEDTLDRYGIPDAEADDEDASETPDADDEGDDATDDGPDADNEGDDADEAPERVGTPSYDEPGFADVDPDEVDPLAGIDPEPPEYESREGAVDDYEPDPNTPPEQSAQPATGAEADEVIGGHTEPQAESDGGYADPTSTTTVEQEYPSDGPASDEEMPLADHIEEMVKRIGVVIVVMAVVSGVVFPFAERLINFLWFSYLPGSITQCPANPDISQGGAACARIYQPLALIFARLKVATLAGFVVALPVFVYETYLFMRPGLYPKERRYYLASVPTSLLLAAAGVAFAHFLVLPAIFTYFVYYSDGATVIAFGLTETFDLMVLMLGGFAIIFQIPLFISLALMMGIVTRRWMAAKRLYFWGAFAGLAFLFSPDPTGMAPIIVAATMIALFEGTLLLAKWTGRE